MFADPKKILESVDLSPGATVVDLGSGVGHYSLAAAKLVAQGDTPDHEGKVYAVEVQKQLLDRLQADAQQQKIHNIHVIWGDLEKLRGTKLADGVADLAIISNVLFQLEQREVFSQEVSRIVKPRGRVLCIDWTSVPLGTPKTQQITKAQAIELFEKVGFALEKEIDAGGQHYGLILRKK